MTAYFAVPYADRIELLVDGAVTSPEGVLTETMSKIWLVPGVPVAITARGTMSECGPLVAHIQRAFVANDIDRAILSLMDSVPTHEALAAPRSFEIVLAIVSPRLGPTLLYCHRSALDDPDEAIPSGKLVTLHGPMAGGSGLDHDELAPFGDMKAALEGGSLELGLALMTAWRAKAATPMDDPEAEPRHAIGAHVDHAVITAEGVNVTRVMTWADDVIGRPISP